MGMVGHLVFFGRPFNSFVGHLVFLGRSFNGFVGLLVDVWDGWTIW